MHDLLAAVNAKRITEDRRYLHAHAEAGFELPATFDYVWNKLTEMGLTPRKCGKSGIIADIGSGERCVLLRADMDALPMQEETGLSVCEIRKTLHPLREPRISQDQYLGDCGRK